jgi:LemA protein
MNDSLLLWLVLALLVFWCVGLYNRVMRIRARGLDAFGSIEKYLRTFGMLVQTHIAGGVDLHSPAVSGSTANIPDAWARLVNNVLALEAAYKVARSMPLTQEPLSRLAAAIAAVQTEWQVLRDEPADLAGSPVPDAMRQQWEEASVKLQSARDAFNQIMARYNEALHQFPARLVVAIMGFQRAAVL